VSGADQEEKEAGFCRREEIGCTLNHKRKLSEKGRRTSGHLFKKGGEGRTSGCRNQKQRNSLLISGVGISVKGGGAQQKVA